MNQIVISSTGLFTPPNKISNHELVASFNAYVAQFNQQYAEKITAGEVEALQESDADFIERASGIKSRHVMDKVGILDTQTMQPIFTKRDDDVLSMQAEMAVSAARQALENGARQAKDVDLIIVACSNLQRAYPAVAIEVQHELGAKGAAYDMNAACSSATFGIQQAYQAIKSGSARAALVISPEICTAHLNFRDRDSHFIFGDACTAVLIEAEGFSHSNNQFQIIDTRTKTSYSNNIRNNLGFLSKTERDVVAEPKNIYNVDRLFMQKGRKVFKDVVPLVSDMLDKHLKKNNIAVTEIKRFWLHQANANMNRVVVQKLIDQKDYPQALAPMILDEYANTSSSGCVIAFHQYHDDLQAGDIGLLCSFGAGYSAGSVIVRKL